MGIHLIINGKIEENYLFKRMPKRNNEFNCLKLKAAVFEESETIDPKYFKSAKILNDEIDSYRCFVMGDFKRRG